MRLSCNIIDYPRPTCVIYDPASSGAPIIRSAELTTVIKEAVAYRQGTSFRNNIVFESSAPKLRNYIIYGNTTGNLTEEGYVIPVTVQKVNHFDASNADIVELYPDTDDIVKVSGTTNYTKQRSFVAEVQPNTWYTVYVNSDESNLTARVAGYSTYPAAGDTALWTDRDLTRLTPPINTFITTADTHYVMVYFSYRRDDVTDILPTIRLIKGSADFNNTVNFVLDTPLMVGQEIRYEECGIDIPAPTYGDCTITFGSEFLPHDVWIQYDSGEVPQIV